MDTNLTTTATSGIQEVITSRRTIHNFKPVPPPQDVLIEAIEVARWAPNHKLTEPWKFYILGKTTSAKVAHFNADRVLQTKGEAAAEKKRARWLSMPSMLVVTCNKCGDPFREKEDYAATCCAVQNMMLFLWSKGIGTKWSTSKSIFTPGFYDIMGIDSGEEEVVGLFWCGYPDEVPATKRKSTSEIIMELP